MHRVKRQKERLAHVQGRQCATFPLQVCCCPVHWKERKGEYAWGFSGACSLSPGGCRAPPFGSLLTFGRQEGVWRGARGWQQRLQCPHISWLSLYSRLAECVPAEVWALQPPLPPTGSTPGHLSTLPRLAERVPAEVWALQLLPPKGSMGGGSACTSPWHRQAREPEGAPNWSLSHLQVCQGAPCLLLLVLAVPSPPLSLPL